MINQISIKITQHNSSFFLWYIKIFQTRINHQWNFSHSSFSQYPPPLFYSGNSVFIPLSVRIYVHLKELSWECPGHVFGITKCPQIMQTVCPVQIFENQFDGDFLHVAPHTLTIIWKISKFSLFSAFVNSSDLHEPIAGVFHLKFRIWGIEGHVLDMSNVLSFVLIFHRTGQRMVPTKVKKMTICCKFKSWWNIGTVVWHIAWLITRILYT